jgi:formylglycine-generating enzyme required for sulfatase activity
MMRETLYPAGKSIASEANEICADQENGAPRTWHDAEGMPLMVEVPAGEFMMGENHGDKFSNDTERPSHRVTICANFALGKFPVTVGEFRRFYDDYAEEDNDALPVVRVNWRDATDFCQWLTERTGRKYRLPSEAEWEYACRAGAQTPFACGNEISTRDANFLHDENGARIGIGRRSAVGSYAPNGFGLHDMHGNVCEWIADTWHPDYSHAPIDGSSWIEHGDTRCVIRGGAWDYLPRLLRSCWRDWQQADQRTDIVGFRVATSDLRISGRT